MTVRGSSDCPVDQPSPPLSLQKGEATQEARNRSKVLAGRLVIEMLRPSSTRIKTAVKKIFKKSLHLV